MSIPAVTRTGVKTPQDLEKLTPVVSAAAVVAALGSEKASQPALRKDDLALQGRTPSFLNANIFRYGQEGGHYGLSGYYNGYWIGVSIDRIGDAGGPITVAGSIGSRRVNLNIAGSYMVSGTVDNQPLQLAILATNADASDFTVSGTVAGKMASLALAGSLTPSANYSLTGQAGTRLIDMNISEQGSDGATYSVSGTID